MVMNTIFSLNNKEKTYFNIVFQSQFPLVTFSPWTYLVMRDILSNWKKTSGDQ